MERDPWMPLVQVRLQLGLHSIFTNKRTVNLWMHRVVVASRILSNQVLSGPILVDTGPYNSTVKTAGSTCQQGSNQADL
ncbi:hypothetical protein DSO57_1012337 [Entomophthora muscae]|uniref:Uncharacterized protein n=1 Tax=Entomophthora muscae TaxID=34485 RepID=A0ACC2SV58_9FUNG|nr:hypothetical protein DSO57_1012337 [Entomophthora muscae]